MPRQLRDSVVVITGASSGIGRATAHAFAREGACVVVAARDESALNDVVRECEAVGAETLAVRTDTTDEAQVRQLAREALDHFGRIDVWVNNAAVGMFGRFEDTPPEDFRKLFDVNVFGYVHGIRAALPTMRAQGGGTIINVASVAGKVGHPYMAPYCGTKFAIVGMSECLREELLDEPIDVCTVCPAAIDTPLFQKSANYTGREIQAIPPVYTPEEVADAIVGCAESPQREVIVGTAGKQMVAMRAVSAAATEHYFRSKQDHDLFRDGEAAPTPGNLYEPVRELASVRGGWGGSRSMNPMALVAVGCIAAGLGMMALNSSRA